MQLKNLLIALFAVLSLSCSPKVEVYDKEVCADLGAEGARCTHTLVDQARDVTKAEWDTIRFGMLCMDSRGFTDTETIIDQICQSGFAQCDYKARERIKEILDRLLALKK